MSNTTKMTYRAERDDPTHGRINRAVRDGEDTEYTFSRSRYVFGSWNIWWDKQPNTPVVSNMRGEQRDVLIALRTITRPEGVKS